MASWFSTVSVGISGRLDLGVITAMALLYHFYGSVTSWRLWWVDRMTSWMVAVLSRCYLSRRLKPSVLLDESWIKSGRVPDHWWHWMWVPWVFRVFSRHSNSLTGKKQNSQRETYWISILHQSNQWLTGMWFCGILCADMHFQTLLRRLFHSTAVNEAVFQWGIQQGSVSLKRRLYWFHNRIIIQLFAKALHVRNCPILLTQGFFLVSGSNLN